MGPSPTSLGSGFPLLKEANRASYDAKERHEIYKRCQRIIYEDVPMEFLWNMPSNSVFTKSVKGYEPDWWGRDVRTVWLDK